MAATTSTSGREDRFYQTTEAITPEDLEDLNSFFSGGGLEKLEKRVSLLAEYVLSTEDSQKGLIRSAWDSIPKLHPLSYFSGRSSLLETPSEDNRRHLLRGLQECKISLLREQLETARKLVKGGGEAQDAELVEKSKRLLKLAGRMDSLWPILDNHSTLARRTDSFVDEIRQDFYLGNREVTPAADIYAALEGLNALKPDEIAGRMLQPAISGESPFQVVEKGVVPHMKEMSEFMGGLIQKASQNPGVLRSLLEKYTPEEKLNMVLVLMQFSLQHATVREECFPGNYHLIDQYWTLASKICDQIDGIGDDRRSLRLVSSIAGTAAALAHALDPERGADKALRKSAMFREGAANLRQILTQSLDLPEQPLKIGETYGGYKFLFETEGYQARGEKFRFFSSSDGKLVMVSTVQGEGVMSVVGRTDSKRQVGQTGIGLHFQERLEAARAAYHKFLEEHQGAGFEKRDLVLYGFGKGAGPLQQFAFETVKSSEKNVLCLTMGTHKWLDARNPGTALRFSDREEEQRSKEGQILLLDIHTPSDAYATGQSRLGAMTVGKAVSPSKCSDVPWAIAVPTYCQNRGMFEGGHQRTIYISDLPQDLDTMNALLSVHEFEEFVSKDGVSANDALGFLKERVLRARSHETASSPTVSWSSPRHASSSASSSSGPATTEVESIEQEPAQLERASPSEEKKSLEILMRQARQFTSMEEIEARITGKTLKQAMDRLTEILQDPEANQSEIAEAKGFFAHLEGLPPQKLNWRERISGKPFGLMGKLLSGRRDIQLWLSPSLKQLTELAPSSGAGREHNFKISQETAKLCARFGYGFQETSAGANGAKFIRNFEGKIFAVYKPIDPERELANWASQKFKSYFGQARLLNTWDAAPQYAEVAARELDDAFDFDLSPLAAMLEFGEAKGAPLGARKGGCVLEFLSGYQELANIKETLDKRQFFSEAELEMFQKIAVYDFLRGNLDGHDENIFVKVGESGELKEMKIIDGGNSFREHNPGAGSHGNCYMWRRLKIAESPFLPSIREFVKGMDLESLTAMFGHEPRFWTPDAQARIIERFWVLKNGVGEGVLPNPRELGRIRRNEDHARFQPAQ